MTTGPWARQQIVLATLSLSAGSVVTPGRLQEAIYGEDLPPASRSQVQISEACLLAGEPARAAVAFELALAKVRATKDPVGEAFVLLGIGVAKTRLGEFGRARSALQPALELAGRLGGRLAGARALHGLGELALTSGDPGSAWREPPRCLSAPSGCHPQADWLPATAPGSPRTASTAIARR